MQTGDDDDDYVDDDAVASDNKKKSEKTKSAMDRKAEKQKRMEERKKRYERQVRQNSLEAGDYFWAPYRSASIAAKQKDAAHFVERRGITMADISVYRASHLRSGLRASGDPLHAQNTLSPSAK
mgnify:CR=1 FL=1